MVEQLGRAGIVAGGAVLVTLLASVGVGHLRVQTPVPAPPVEISGRSTVICPAEDGLAALVASAREDGALDVGGLAPGTDRPGTTNTVTAYDDLTGPLVIGATGPQSGASAAGVHANRDDGPDRGLSIGTCPEPGGLHWFSGLGGSDTMRSVIVLTNPDDRQVSVDVTLHGPDGELATPGTRGIVVPARETREVSVESYVDTDDLVSARVQARNGRVAAIVRDRAGGDTPRGATYAAESSLPAPDLVIPGVPDGPGGRRLVVVNPGERRTGIHVEVLGPDGTFVPVGGEQVPVNAGASVSVDLGPGLAEQAGAVRLTADQPITGAVVSTSSGDPNRQDLAVQPAAAPLRGMALAPVAALPGVSAAVIVSNTGTTEAVVPLRAVTAAGDQLAENQMVVPAGGTRVWQLPETGEPASVIATAPPGGALHAGVLLSSAEGFDRMATAPFVVPRARDEGPAPQPEPRLG